MVLLQKKLSNESVELYNVGSNSVEKLATFPAVEYLPDSEGWIVNKLDHAPDVTQFATHEDSLLVGTFTGQVYRLQENTCEKIFDLIPHVTKLHPNLELFARHRSQFAYNEAQRQIDEFQERLEGIKYEEDEKKAKDFYSQIIRDAQNIPKKNSPLHLDAHAAFLGGHQIKGIYVDNNVPYVATDLGLWDLTTGKQVNPNYIMQLQKGQSQLYAAHGTRAFLDEILSNTDPNLAIKKEHYSGISSVNGASQTFNNAVPFDGSGYGAGTILIDNQNRIHIAHGNHPEYEYSTGILGTKLSTQSRWIQSMHKGPELEDVILLENRREGGMQAIYSKQESPIVRLPEHAQIFVQGNHFYFTDGTNTLTECNINDAPRPTRVFPLENGLRFAQNESNVFVR